MRSPSDAALRRRFLLMVRKHTLALLRESLQQAYVAMQAAPEKAGQIAADHLAYCRGVVDYLEAQERTAVGHVADPTAAGAA